MFALSLTIYEIFAIQENPKILDLENKGQGQGIEERGLSRSTGNVKIYIIDFFNFSYQTKSSMHNWLKTRTKTIPVYEDNEILSEVAPPIYFWKLRSQWAHSNVGLFHSSIPLHLISPYATSRCKWVDWFIWNAYGQCVLLFLLYTTDIGKHMVYFRTVMPMTRRYGFMRQHAEKT